MRGALWTAKCLRPPDPRSLASHPATVRCNRLLARSAVEVFESRSATLAKGFSSCGDPREKLRMILEPILEPIFLGTEANQNPGWFAVARNDDFGPLRQAKVPRQVVFHFGQRDLMPRAHPTRGATSPPALC